MHPNMKLLINNTSVFCGGRWLQQAKGTVAAGVISCCDYSLLGLGYWLAQTCEICAMVHVVHSVAIDGNSSNNNNK
jgi:hypothetical protein